MTSAHVTEYVSCERPVSIELSQSDPGRGFGPPCRIRAGLFYLHMGAGAAATAHAIDLSPKRSRRTGLALCSWIC